MRHIHTERRRSSRAAGRMLAPWLCFGLAVLVGPIPAAADMVGHGGVIRAVSVSNDGRLALSASFDHTVRLWAFDEQRQIRVLDGHDGPVNAASFVLGADRAVSAGADGRVIEWDLKTGKKIKVLEGHRGRVMSLAVARASTRIISGGWDGRLNIWDLDTGALVRAIETGTPVSAVAVGNQGKTLLAGGNDGKVRIYRRTEGAALGRIAAHDFGLTFMAASNDGRRLLTIGLDNAARVWDLNTLAKISQYLPDPVVKPVAAALSGDGRFMLIGYLSGDMIHMDAETGRVLRTVKAESGPIWSVSFSPDGRFALTAGVEERVKVWHLETGDRIDVHGGEGRDRPMPWLTSNHPGARHYRKCAGCHALTADEAQRSGPHLAGLFGRPAGAVKGYRYSAALRTASLVWTRETLTELFRRGPDRYLPGTKMPVQQITDPRHLSDLVDYVAELTADK